MSKYELEQKKKLIAAKMLLDTFEIPKRPATMSAHQFKKKFGTNQGYAEYKKNVRKEREEWDFLYKNLHKNLRKKNKYLTEVNLSDDALAQASEESESRGLTIPEILSEWIEAGRKKSN